MSRNVQKYSKEVYLRASEAQQCRVHSTVVLPLFTAGDRGTSLGIIEVVQTRQDMSFADIVTHLAQALEVSCHNCMPAIVSQEHSRMICCSFQRMAVVLAMAIRLQRYILGGITQSLAQALGHSPSLPSVILHWHALPTAMRGDKYRQHICECSVSISGVVSDHACRSVTYTPAKLPTSGQRKWRSPRTRSSTPFRAACRDLSR